MKTKTILITVLILILSSFIVSGAITPSKWLDGLNYYTIKDYVNITNTALEDIPSFNTITYIKTSNFTDLQTEILNAEENDKIIVPKGTYFADSIIRSASKNWSLLINNSGVTIECLEGARIVKDGTVDNHAMIGSGSSSHNDITIKGCNFDGNYTNSTYSSFGTSEYKGAGLVQYADNWRVIDNTFDNMGEYGGIVWHGSDGIISNNIIKSSQKYSDARKKYASCIMITYLTAVGNIISDNVCLNPDGNGLFFEDNADYNTVSNFYVQNAFRGYSSEHTSHNIISGLNIFNSTEISIHQLSSNNNLITDFLIESGQDTQDSITIVNSLVPADGHDIMISDGLILNSPDDAVYCRDTPNVTFTNIRSINPTNYDLKVNNCSDYTLYITDLPNQSITSSSRRYYTDDMQYNDLDLTGDGTINGKLMIGANTEALQELEVSGTAGQDVALLFDEGGSNRWSIGISETPNNFFAIGFGNNLTDDVMLFNVTSKKPTFAYGMDWTNLDNYPAQCSVTNSFITQLNDSTTCTTIDTTDLFNQSITSIYDGQSNALLLPLNNNVTKPTLGFGDGDTGIYESADDNLAVSVSATKQFHIENGAIVSASSNGYKIMKETASDTNPVYAFDGDTDTGIGWAGDDELSIIAGGAMLIDIVEGTSDYVDFPTYLNITGVDDSGFKCLIYSHNGGCVIADNSTCRRFYSPSGSGVVNVCDT